MGPKRLLALGAIASVVSISVAASLGLNPYLIRLLRVLPGHDITGHFVVMAALCGAVLAGFDGARLAGRRLGLLELTAFVAAAAVFDEWLQRYIPGRIFSLTDLAAGLLGTATAALIVAVWRSGEAPLLPEPAAKEPGLGSDG